MHDQVKEFSDVKKQAADFYINDVGKVKSLHGLSEVQVFSILGSPKTKETINLSEGLLEYQIELYKLFEEKEPNIDLIEMTWLQKKETMSLRLILWFQIKNNQLSVLDSLIYDQNSIEF